MQILRGEIKPGSRVFYAMGNGGMKLFGRVSYLKLQRPDRIVYTQQFCDEHEHLARHPGTPVWPATMHTTVTLNEEGPNTTRVTVEWQPAEDATAEEIAAFVAMRTSMTQGWTGSFDKLEALLG